MDLTLGLGDTAYRAHRARPGELVLSRENADPHRVHVLQVGVHDFLVRKASGFHPAQAVRDGETVWVRYQGRTYRFDIVRGRSRASRAGRSRAWQGAARWRQAR